MKVICLMLIIATLSACGGNKVALNQKAVCDGNKHTMRFYWGQTAFDEPTRMADAWYEKNPKVTIHEIIEEPTSESAAVTYSCAAI